MARARTSRPVAGLTKNRAQDILERAPVSEHLRSHQRRSSVKKLDLRRKYQHLYQHKLKTVLRHQAEKR